MHDIHTYIHALESTSTSEYSHVRTSTSSAHVTDEFESFRQFQTHDVINTSMTSFYLFVATVCADHSMLCQLLCGRSRNGPVPVHELRRSRPRWFAWSNEQVSTTSAAAASTRCGEQEDSVDDAVTGNFHMFTLKNRVVCVGVAGENGPWLGRNVVEVPVHAALERKTPSQTAS